MRSKTTILMWNSKARTKNTHNWRGTKQKLPWLSWQFSSLPNVNKYFIALGSVLSGWDCVLKKSMLSHSARVFLTLPYTYGTEVHYWRLVRVFSHIYFLCYSQRMLGGFQALKVHRIGCINIRFFFAFSKTAFLTMKLKWGCKNPTHRCTILSQHKFAYSYYLYVFM